MQTILNCVPSKNIGSIWMRCCLVFFCCVGMISPSWGGATPYYGWMFFFDQAVLSESGKLDEGVMSRVEYDNTVDMFDDPTDEDTKQILHPIIEEMVNFYIDNLKTNLTDTQRAVNLPSHTAKFEAWAQGESGQDLEYLKNAFQIKMKCEDWYKRLVALCKAYRKYEQNSGVGSSVVVVDYASKSYTQSPGRTIDYVASAEVHQQYDMFVNDLHKELLQECNLSGKVQRFKLALEERMREVAQQSFNDCLVLDIKNFSATLGKGASASVHMMCSRMLRAAGIPLRYNLTRVNKGANQKKTSVHVHLYQEWSEGEKVEEWPPALQVQFFTAGRFLRGVDSRINEQTVAVNKSLVRASGASSMGGVGREICQSPSFVTIDDKQFLNDQTMFLGVSVKGIFEVGKR